MKTPGQIAYEAYRSAVNFQNNPVWEALSMDLRTGWETAAGAVIEADIEAADEPQTIEEWQKAIHAYACEKGWWDNERSFGDICSLIHSEVTEAFEEHRNGHAFDEVYTNPEKPGKLEGVPVELADVVIRILDFAQWAKIDLQDVMARKHAFNLTRPYRHGGKKV
jgi:NTP pyrophosphatase (non-canonical NTP hydrolase)